MMTWFGKLVHTKCTANLLNVVIMASEAHFWHINYRCLPEILLTLTDLFCGGFLVWWLYENSMNMPQTSEYCFGTLIVFQIIKRVDSNKLKWQDCETPGSPRMVGRYDSNDWGLHLGQIWTSGKWMVRICLNVFLFQSCTMDEITAVFCTGRSKPFPISVVVGWTFAIGTFVAWFVYHFFIVPQSLRK